MPSMEKIPNQKIYEQHEAMPKGIAFVFSRGVERNEHGEIIGLDENGKERLNKAIELYIGSSRKSCTNIVSALYSIPSLYITLNS